VRGQSAAATALSRAAQLQKRCRAALAAALQNVDRKRDMAAAKKHRDV